MKFFWLFSICLVAWMILTHINFFLVFLNRCASVVPWRTLVMMTWLSLGKTNGTSLHLERILGAWFVSESVSPLFWFVLSPLFRFSLSVLSFLCSWEGAEVWSSSQWWIEVWLPSLRSPKGFAVVSSCSFPSLLRLSDSWGDIAFSSLLDVECGGGQSFLSSVCCLVSLVLPSLVVFLALVVIFNSASVFNDVVACFTCLFHSVVLFYGIFAIGDAVNWNLALIMPLLLNMELPP